MGNKRITLPYHLSPITYHFLISRAKRCPIVRGRLLKSIPVILKTVGELLHLAQQGSLFAQCAKVIAVGFVLRERNHLAVAKLAQDGYVCFANRRAKLSAPRQSFGFVHQVCRSLFRRKPLA